MLYNWHGSGMSVMEMSHRGKEFLSIIQKVESDLKALLDIPAEYVVLFLQGDTKIHPLCFVPESSDIRFSIIIQLSEQYFLALIISFSALYWAGLAR